MKKNKEKTIEEKYQELSPEEHVLKKSGMYIGSIKPHQYSTWLYKNDTMQTYDIEYIPAFLKLFDEILSNSIDESKRKGTKLNVIKVNIENDDISIWDNGGIPVEIHKGKKMYVPEFIFSSLRSGSNFDDDDNRVGVGTNGIGSILNNLFSTKFIVSTCDGKKSFYQEFTNNMSSRTKPVIKDSKKNHTQITYTTDFKRFNMTKIDDTHLSLIYKRVIDSAAINPKVKHYFNNVEIKINTFENYIKLYSSEYIIDETKHRWNLAVAPSEMGFKQVSFVNSSPTLEGGSHTDYILNQIITKVREFILKKHKIDVKPSEIKNHIFLFLDAEVVNPIFNSQTKEKLVSEVKDFGCEYIVSEKFIQQIIKSEIVNSILDWYKQKKEADDNKELRKLNKSLTNNKVSGLVDAKATKNRELCELFIIEGESAKNGIIKYRNPTLQGGLPIRGKLLNVFEAPPSKLMQDEQVTNIMSAIGLKIGEEPKNLRYGKIFISNDQDNDGFAVAALLINFFYKYWKKLFEDGRIYLNITPLLVAINKKTKERIYFYTDAEFKKWCDKKDIKIYDIDYKKGLGSLENIETKELVTKPKLIKINITNESSDILYTWFGDDSSLRKSAILASDGIIMSDISDIKNNKNTNEKKSRTSKRK